MNKGLVALGIAAWGTTVVHLSKGMMRDGLAGLAGKNSKRRRALIYYVAAVILNHTSPLWIIFANAFAPAVYYSSVYALGLVPLLAFASWRLREKVATRAWIGASIIVVGTALAGHARLALPMVDTNGAAIPFFLAAVALFTILSLFVLTFFRKRMGPQLRETLFGLSAGSFSAIDAMMKGFAQRLESPGLLPDTFLGWFMFLASFAYATGAFLTTNWGFMNGCKAGPMITIYTSTFVLLPVVVTFATSSDPGMAISPALLLGLSVTVVGVFLARTQGGGRTKLSSPGA